MDVERLLHVAFLVSYLTLRELVHGKEKANCQQFKFVIDEDVIHDHILEGHVFKRLTVASAAKCHVICKDDCLCASMNYFPSSKGNNCELNNANKETEPSAMKWKSGANYYDLVRIYTVKDGKEYIPGKHKCVNRCCRPNPCVNGGDCKEICNPKGKRFNCTCPATHTGQRCETKLARSCKDVAENNGNLTSGNYTTYDSTKKKFPVYCDMESEAEFVWTLIQSFSLGNKGTFENKGFGVDFPKNDANSYVDWSAYRLSLPHMQYLANNSTHLRVTCNYPTEGLKYTDYARAKLEGHDIFGTWSSLCHHYEYINIRGNNCRDCTAGTKQTNGSVWSINSYSSKMKFGCDLDGRPGADGYENNFDVYYGGKIHPAHRCSSSPDSTTQHWFGALHNL